MPHKANYNPGTLTARMGRTKKAGTRSEFVFCAALIEILYEIDPDMAITTASLKAMEDMMTDNFKQIATEAAVLARRSGKAKISVREIETAVSMIFPPRLALHARSSGNKALARVKLSK